MHQRRGFDRQHGDEHDRAIGADAAVFHNLKALRPRLPAAETVGRTGVEMEALTAVSVAALTVIDMVKAIDKHGRITDIRVTAKSGGRSGDWREDPADG